LPKHFLLFQLPPLL